MRYQNLTLSNSVKGVSVCMNASPWKSLSFICPLPRQRERSVGMVSDYVTTIEGKQVGIRGKIVAPAPITAIVTFQPPKDTARPINLPHYHRYGPSAPKGGTRWETGWRSGWWVWVRGSGLLMGGSAVEGRNKSAEWKIRKRNLSHHCWLPLSPLSRCKRSMDSRGEARVSAQLLHLFKWDSQLHEVRPRILSICSSATAVHVWVKEGRHTVETEGDGESAVWADLRERNRINWFLKITPQMHERNWKCGGGL